MIPTTELPVVYLTDTEIANTISVLQSQLEELKERCAILEQNTNYNLLERLLEETLKGGDI